MAIRIIEEYPGNVDPVVAATWPDGEPRNVSAPAANDGTPFEAAMYKDLEGFKQFLLKASGIAPSGTPENAQTSQLFQALQALFLEVADRRSQGGDILEVADRLLPLGGFGCREVYVSSVRRQTLPGSRRNVADTKDLSIAPAMSKDTNSEWVPGNLLGGTTAEGIALYIANGTTHTPLRRFLVNKPDGTADIVFSPDVDAADFFAGLGAAAGFSDNTLYRRLSWAVVDNSGTSHEWTTNEDVPGLVTLRDTFAESISAASSGGSRELVNMDEMPPNVLATMHCSVREVNNGSGPHRHLFSEESDSDRAATTSRNTLQSGASSDDASMSSVVFQINTGDNRVIGYRNDGAVNDIDLHCAGWQDNGVIL